MRSLLICTGLALAVAAGSPPAVAVPLDGVEAAAYGASAPGAAHRPALRGAIDAELAAAEAAVAELSAQIAVAPDVSSALALVRALEQRKRRAALQLSVLQSERAGAAGHEAAAARLSTGDVAAPASAPPASLPPVRDDPDIGASPGGRP